MLRLLGVVLIFLVAALSQAQELPRCFFRPQTIILLRTHLGVCPELILSVPYLPGRVFTSIAVDEARRLYLAEPTAGTVWRADDTDGDGVPDALQPFLTALDTPASLLYHANTLYIAGGQRLYAYDGATLVTLRDDLPVAAGQTVRLLLVRDGRLLLSMGGCAGCDQPAQVLSLALDGSGGDLMVMRKGALAAADGEALFFTVGNGQDGLYALGDDGDIRRLMGLPSGAEPVALVPYDGEAFPQFSGQALLLLAGTELAEDPPGFMLLAVDGLGQEALQVSTLIPGFIDMPVARVPIGGEYRNPQANTFNRNGDGLYPQRLMGLAVDDRGWIYVLLARGAVIMLRP
ncbi:MAG: hypothetical protein SNJ54_08495 [Anaerolineae bacterium]